MKLAFDIEADDLLEGVTRVHCICSKDLNTGKEWQFRPHEIPEALEHLHAADELIGHNIIGYDIPTLVKLYGWRPKPKQTIRDTQIWAKLLHSDLKDEDLSSSSKTIRALGGRHALRAWGVRLGILKDEYEAGFDEFCEEMLSYCSQDVRVTEAVYRHCEKLHVSDEALALEQRFAVYVSHMEQRGFTFDVEAAEKLCEALQAKLDEITEQFKTYVPPVYEEQKTPAYWLMRWPDGTEEKFPTKGAAEVARKQRKIGPKECLLSRGPNKRKEIPFNPGSAKQIREMLWEKYQWKSPALTNKGKELLKAEQGTYDELVLDFGKITEDILRGLSYEEAPLCADAQMVRKRISQITTGSKAWLKQVRPDGKIHHRMDTIGCVSMRCAHSNPNLGQVPHVLEGKDADGNKVPLWGYEGRYGSDCRALFKPSNGLVLVGVDLSGIEGRMLAHYLSRYDGGAYIDQVLNGDIHQLNADAFQKYANYEVSRNGSKTPYYAWMYGAGLAKLGQSVSQVSKDAREHFEIARDRYRNTQNEQKATYMAYREVGQRVEEAFKRGIVGLDRLLEAVKASAKRGYLTVLDGRRIPIRKEHSALNTLLQGSAAIVMKRWVTGTFDDVRRRQMAAWLLAVIHDEMQTECEPDVASDFAELSLQYIKRAGEYYRLAIPLDGEAKIGHNWQETH